MALDEYKTQILLLHSEQSTLDTLSSGFNDRYTVHCATSGSEALNTLVETPINVIVSAQNLPGMSGLDALREAKKRSPETIGILLAGNASSGLEAMVGDEEVFQVVRGKVTSDGLLELVENATRQMRLMALAESANDTAANPDEPAAEHIVMETSENGSTIISDGTGRMRALDPKKLSTAAAVGSRAVDVLVLTQDREFLETIKESSRGMHTVHTANTLAQADDAIHKHKVGVAVVDAAMVGEKVEQLTQHLRKGSARLVAIVAGRRDDGEMLMDLINRGKVYRFLLKPVSPGRARLAVEASVKHHLEAPKAAFRVKGSAPKPMPKPASVNKAKTTAKSALDAKPRSPARSVSAPPKVARTSAPKTPSDSRDAARKSAPIAAPTRREPPIGSAAANSKSPINKSPLDEGLADAFGEDDTSFAETVTGLISAVTERFSGDDSSALTEIKVDPQPQKFATTDSAGASSGGSLFKNPLILGLGAVAAVVLGALLWMMSGSEDVPVMAPVSNTSVASIAETETDLVPAPAEESSSDISALVDDARQARDSGQIFSPDGANAIELFAAAMNAEPGNAVIAAELDAVVATALGTAETAILESNLDIANTALERVRATDADNARLPFLGAQLTQLQLRGYLDEARGAIRDTRFEDAAIALTAARGIEVSDTTEIDTIASELDIARSQQQVDDVLAKATARVEAGKLLSPANDNARYYYDLVLSNDPENSTAQQGLSIIASKLGLQARTEIDNGNLSHADDLLKAARAVDASNSDLPAIASALADARAAVAEQARQVRLAAAAEAKRIVDAEIAAEAARIAEQERLRAAQAASAGQVEEPATNEPEKDEIEAPATDTPEKFAAVVLGDNAPSDTLDLANENTSGDSADRSTAAVATNSLAPEDESIDITDAISGGSAKTASAVRPSVMPPMTRSLNKVPVGISMLNRVKYVAPKYPRSAQRRRQSGWVDIVFTVTVTGNVKDILIRESKPAETFDASAVKAVEKWKFEPVTEDGILVEKRAGVRMIFAVE